MAGQPLSGSKLAVLCLIIRSDLLQLHSWAKERNASELGGVSDQPQLLIYTLRIGDGVIDQCDRLEKVEIPDEILRNAQSRLMALPAALATTL